MMTAGISLLSAVSLAGVLSGRVVDEEGAPLEDMAIYALDLRMSYHSTLSDEEGAWELQELEAGWYRVWAQPPSGSRAVARGWPEAWEICQSESLELGADDRLENLELQLPWGASLHGRVLDPSGQALAGVEVLATGAHERVSGVRVEAVTDESGRFSLHGLDGDRDGADYLIEFTPEARWPEQFPGPVYEEEESPLFRVFPGQEHTAGTHQLAEGIEVEGEIYGPGGLLGGAEVHVYSSSQVVDLVAGEDGSYRADALPPGEVLSWGWQEGHAVTYYPDADRPGERVLADQEGDRLQGVDLFLPAEAALEGALSLEGAEDLSGVTLLAYNDDRTVGLGAQAEADGSFRADRLHPGDYTLYIYAEEEGSTNGFLLSAGGEEEIFTVEEGETLDLGLIELAPAARISGQVLSEEGAPVHGAYVYAQSADEQGGSEAITTDREGRYELDGLRAGSWEIEVFYAPYCDGDLDYVTLYWPGTVSPDQQELLTLTEGQLREGLDWVMPLDADGDGMSDLWEEEQGLDPGRDDSGEDPDGDGLSNLEEYLLGSSPQVLDEQMLGSDRCLGCRGQDQLAWVLILPLLSWRRRCARSST